MIRGLKEARFIGWKRPRAMEEQKARRKAGLGFCFVVQPYGFTNVASIVDDPPAVTVIVLCQGRRLSFSIET